MCFCLNLSPHPQGPVYWLLWLYHLPLTSWFPLLQPHLPPCWSLNIPQMQFLKPFTYHTVHQECPFPRYLPGSLPCFLSLPSNVTLLERSHPNQLFSNSPPLSPFHPLSLYSPWFFFKILITPWLVTYLLVDCLPQLDWKPPKSRDFVCLIHCTSLAPG